MTHPSLTPGRPRFCSACGMELTGPVQRCPGCGAAVMRARRRLGPVAVVALVVGLGVTCLVGIPVAIAIPGFLHHQKRSREVVVKMELRELVQAEQAILERDGSFVAFEPLPSQPPSAKKTPLSAAQRRLADRLGWAIGPTTHGQFRIAVTREPSGVQTASFCAETDLDGDGTRAAHVAFLAAQLEDGGIVAAPPAPCTKPVPYSDQVRPGELVKVEPLDY